MRGSNAPRRPIALLLMVGLAGCATRQPFSGDVAREQVLAAERAFARTMAERDFAGFQSFLSGEAIFFTGPAPLRGKAAVAGFWARYYRDVVAPFSWEPDEVQVLDWGRLALSAGPVRDPQGRLIGRFSSVWRQEKPGVWRIVFDRGESAPAR